jgi:hypothetical protein
MKTNTLILTAALGLAGLASSQAQVFSSNAVGYVNISLTAGDFAAIHNPLKSDDNLIGTVLAGAEEGTVVYKWNGAGYSISALDFGAWSDPAMELPNGAGFFIISPTDATLTFVGEVEQSASNALSAGFNLIGSQVPQAGTATQLELPAQDGTIVYQWNVTNQAYGISTFDFGAWDSEPSFGVGEAFFVSAPAATSWDREFDINAQ